MAGLGFITVAFLLALAWVSELTVFLVTCCSEEEASCDMEGGYARARPPIFQSFH
jgi:hypothetical protein